MRLEIHRYGPLHDRAYALALPAGGGRLFCPIGASTLIITSALVYFPSRYLADARADAALQNLARDA